MAFAHPIKANRTVSLFRDLCLERLPSKKLPIPGAVPVHAGLIRAGTLYDFGPKATNERTIAHARVITDFVDRPLVGKEECFATIWHFALTSLHVSVKLSAQQEGMAFPFVRYDIDAQTMELVKSLGISIGGTPASDWCVLKGGIMLKESARAANLTNGLIEPENTTVQVRMHTPRLSKGGALISGRLGLAWHLNPTLGERSMEAPYNAPFLLLEQAEALLKSGVIYADTRLAGKIFNSTMRFFEFLEQISRHLGGQPVKINSLARPTVVYERDINPLRYMSDASQDKECIALDSSQ